MYAREEEFDNLVWDKNDEEFEKATDYLRLTTTCRQVERLAQEKLGRSVKLVPPIIPGGFNVLYRVRIGGESHSPDFLVRLPYPSLVQFPEEKTAQEAATAAFLAKGTDLLIPRPVCHGQDPTLGPFLILPYIAHKHTMSDELTAPCDDPTEHHVLDPRIPEDTLEHVWGKVARCLLQISRITFPRIGSLVEVGTGAYKVAGRPLTQAMTEMIRLANIPRAVLPPEGTTFQSADEWLTALSEMLIAQLVFQHNDFVTSEEDCRNKYVVRQIFRRLAREGRLSTFGFAEDNWSAQSRSAKTPSSNLAAAPPKSHSFRLWGDDFGAGNILLDESNEIASLIDWEYAYAAPTQFSLDPPWWLLLDSAENWVTGIDDWKDLYEQRLKTWFSALEKAELGSKETNLSAPLSRYMRESWETGRYFLSHGLRKPWSFDLVYWKYLDERFFGPRADGVCKDDLWKTRVHLLTDKERRAMEPFVESKMNDAKVRRIVEWDADQAKQRLAEFLFD